MSMLTGEPIMVNDDMDDSLHGDFYDERRNKALKDKGEWSDSLFDCFDDKETCLFSCLCPCYILHRSIDRMGRINTPIGVMDSKKYIIYFGILFLFTAFIAPRIPPDVSCRTMDGKHITPHDTELYQQQFNYNVTHGIPAYKVHYHCVTLTTYLMNLISWILTFFVMRGLRDKLMVQEHDGLTFLKVTCCPDCYLCLQCCAINQMARHVNRSQGFVPAGPAETEMLAGNGQFQRRPDDL